ncbi:hypothetical protein IRZ71_14000 [Flavobacterium sp. ANB]|uniref:hypothetical protein n=1 Tax=unclassified Flavobacterium TaxID=196869 RepID=UPI0012B88C26|nr:MULTISPECIES: hypothetical protein [unclassified Flavobacterium]MBF4517473.1 hypothetical protein [Flavobacterium sp. ANB]MTD72103.1 hypothetical protein [Flavobacterium sp. LC2016-13]
MKLNSLFILLFLTNLSFAQFQTTGKIKEVAENGFHEIVLSPEIRSYSKQDLSDIRIFNAKGIEVPYFIQSNSETLLSTFEEYTIVSKTVSPKKSTSVIVAIPSVKNNNQLSLFIANADVVKNYSISGSNDQTEWFGISNSQTLDNLNSSSETSVVKTISYPLSTYKYLKIDFDDRKTLPINILKVGNFNAQLQKNILQEIKPEKFVRTELTSQKQTEIHFLFDAPQIINQIAFKISEPTFYKRNAIIYKKVKQQIKHKSEIYDEEIVSFELNSNTKNIFTIPEIFEKDFYLKIENKDNQPLTISSVKYSQKPVSVIVDLNANEKYSLKTGNKNLNEPEYDLSDFKNSITGKLPQTNIYEIKQIVSSKNQAEKKSFWQQGWFMWLCIVLGGITILYFTASLVKDLKEKN